jgi:hypothetical protein
LRRRRTSISGTIFSAGSVCSGSCAIVPPFWTCPTAVKQPVASQALTEPHPVRQPTVPPALPRPSGRSACRDRPETVEKTMWGRWGGKVGPEPRWIGWPRVAGGVPWVGCPWFETALSALAPIQF